MRAGGHFWTIMPAVGKMILPPRGAKTIGWKLDFVDEGGEPVALSGRWRDVQGARALAILVHGLGGDPTSPYVVELAGAMEARGFATLRYAMRGASNGSDMYHSGLFQDLRRVLADPVFKRYEEIVVVGFSLGGHVTMRLAASDDLDPRVAAMAAICSPLDLDAVVRRIDHPRGYLYRNYVLDGLKQHYARVARNRERLPAPLARVRRARTVQEFDALVTVPRYGFGTLDHYYESEAASRVLHKITRPLLYAATLDDPMVPAATSRPHLERASSHVQVRWIERGGHVYFPPRVDLGVSEAEATFHAQLIGWLERHLAGA